MLATGRSKRCNAPGPPLPTSSPAGREHAPTQHTKRDPGFSLVAIGERFAFLPDWYRRGEARRLALAYYFVLRGALGSVPGLRDYLVRCRHCRIFFLCDPRNRGREDLGCPFGCADAHRKEQSARRSAAYWRTSAGRMKKAQLNGRRRGGGSSGSEVREESAGSGSEESQAPAELEVTESEAAPERRPEAIRFSAGIVDHVRRVTSLIEGVVVRREEVLSMLERVVRQHSILADGRRAYVLRWLWEHSP